MFGTIWYRTKVLRILRESFGYEPAVPGWQSKVFNDVTKHAKKQGGNEYDGAIVFMIVQIEALKDSEDLEVIEWKSRMSSIVSSLMPMSRFGNDLIENHPH
ncbi:hypothetical protein D5687_10645 [Guyparkeria sp. SCN-R1]|nr:hypothetical protein D5687_10645 [Guyparkeria sp. SCN-R1]